MLEAKQCCFVVFICCKEDKAIREVVGFFSIFTGGLQTTKCFATIPRVVEESFDPFSPARKWTNGFSCRFPFTQLSVVFKLLWMDDGRNGPPGSPHFA